MERGFSIRVWIGRKITEYTSRKFMTLVLATWLLYMGKIEAWVWLVVAGVFIGANAAEKLITKLTTGAKDVTA